MGEWIPMGDGFMEADVIRWRDPVKAKAPAKRGPAAAEKMKIGERLVTAEVVGEPDEEGWMWLIVRGCEVLWCDPGKQVPNWAPGRRLTRHVNLIKYGKPERMPWAEEGARAAVKSSFLGRKPVSSRSGDREDN